MRYFRIVSSVLLVAIMGSSGLFSLLPRVHGQPTEGTLLADFIVPGSSGSIGIGFDGAHLYWPDRFQDILHKVTTQGAFVADIPISGCSATVISYDSSRGVFWGASGTQISQITPAGSCTPQFDVADNLPGECDTGVGCELLIDGISYDSNDDSIWYSPDASQIVYHYSTDGALLGFFHVNIPPNDMLNECGFNYNSGVAVGGINVIYLAADGCDTIFKYDKQGTKLGSFVIGAQRHEDMECDDVTFAGQGTDAVWIKDAEDEHIRAFAVSRGTCHIETTAGIRTIFPSQGGNTGSVSVEIRGSGFLSGATVRLVATGEQEIVGNQVEIAANGRAVFATFDLTGAQPGVRDVVVAMTGGEEFRLAEAFTVLSGGDSRLWLDIIGRDQIRVGTRMFYWYRIQNLGEVDATQVVLHVGLQDVSADSPLKIVATEKLEGGVWTPITSRNDGFSASLSTVPSQGFAWVRATIFAAFAGENPCLCPKVDWTEHDETGVIRIKKLQPECREPTPVQSQDPNDKVGIGGVGTRRFVPNVEDFAYAIFFENLANATAPAENIIITDRLDPNLDRTSLAVIETSHPQYLRSAFNITSGTVTWTFTGINLPPNINPPEGEGWIIFTVRPKANLPSGTEIRNKASIVFDVNPPIETKEWVNVIDNSEPSSQVSQLPASHLPGRFAVQWSGNDPDSGVLDYSVYVSENNGPYRVWLRDTENETAMFTGEEGKTYSFYSVARDKTGNLEDPSTTPDATTRVSTPIWRLAWFWLSVGIPAILVSTLVYFFRRRRRTTTSSSMLVIMFLAERF